MIAVPIAILAVVGVAFLLRPWPFFLASEDSSQNLRCRAPVVFAMWVERQARARGLSVRGVERSVLLECRKCGRKSNYFVYPDEVCERCWHASLKPVPSQTKEQHP